jgi:hypothetical protein
MYLVSIIIILTLLLAIKTFVNDIVYDIPNNLSLIPTTTKCNLRNKNTGNFANNGLVDLAGVRENYGLTSLATGINYRGGSIYSNPDNDEENNEGSGNFTNRVYQDNRYLEDIMDNNCSTDICMNKGCSGKIVGTKCATKCSVNPSSGYNRTFGDNIIKYNDDISDPLFKTIQVKDKQIYIPWSDAYNNIVE